ncbi:hypothetical protein IVG45_01560 [Methylomonas sp. LL1]|uniref:hypothetical protein n=1 Tax=Methylomonas sp. LL1 TaxID=2785785 RepID=UPI0018C44BB6|nr:hypothetical protein [Methylomonas sp. LL1]QPK63693.1 hypothetical protein IVG45_01560 [Methylomonas sp. LL1]
MLQLFASSLGFFALSLALAVNAEPGPSVSIPEKVSSNILKRHPKAQDMLATQETHFGQKLLEVSFKDETGQEILELFTAKGHLFTNEIKIEDLSEITPPVIASLKQEFPNYELQRAELIVNPNSVGEEYEIYLASAGKNWKVAIKDNGTILDKQQLNP